MSSVIVAFSFIDAILTLAGYATVTLQQTHDKIVETNLSNSKKYVCIPRSFLVINVCNQGKTLCSPCIAGDDRLILRNLFI
jgi:hypothetical protein